MSSRNETAELLQIPAGTGRPTAYQILGLEPLEEDAQRIAAAIRSRAAHLKAQKASASPAAWKAAVTAFEKARSILTDTAVKERYDQQLRRELAKAEPNAAPARSAAPQHEPPPELAAVLPAADPSAPFDSQTYLQEHPELASQSDDEEDIDRLLFGDEPPATNSSDAGPAAVTAPAAAISPSPRPAIHAARRRRRTFPGANLVMGLVVILLFVGIGATLYALVRQGEDRGPRITAADPAPRVSPSAPDRDPDATADPVPRTADPVMGNLPAADSAPPITSGRGSDTEFRMPQPSGSSADADDVATSGEPPAPEAAPMLQDPSVTETPGDQPAPEPAQTPSSTAAPQPMEERTAAGEEAFERAAELVRENAWNEMAAAAEAAETAAVTDAQQQQAARLDRLVRYALEYRRAIRAGGQKIGAGESFELQPNVRVVMVENSDERIIIRASGRNRSYDGYDNLPPVLEHAFARMELDADHPTTIAYKAAYQAISRQSTPEHRQQAFDWWDEAAADSDEIDIEGLQELVERLFSES